ncbi:MAG: hypothetical protein IJX16_05840 [Clostridia bacterium]|nr:hypothetical protein [Clostridia bacterium]
MSDCKFNLDDIVVLCEERKEYIKSISDEKRKRQSLLVWKLLEFAIYNVYGKKQLNFFNDNGRWYDADGKINFSLSHSNNIVAVGVSDTPIGVDVEMVSEKILKLKAKLNPPENVENVIEYLTKKWTEKESLFKAGRGKKFETLTVFDKSCKYFLTVCTNKNEINFNKIDINKILE